MGHLEISYRGQNRIFSLEGRSAWSIGRAEESDLFLNDLTISRHQCKVERVGASFYLKDEGSSSGTFVNGARVTGGTLLRDGDDIRVGNISLVFRQRKAAQPARPASGRPEVTIVSAAGLPPAIDSRLQKTTYSLKPRLLLGRDPECDVVLPSPYVSGHHAEIRQVKEVWTVRDLDSSNGTAINGQPVLGRAEIRQGDRIRIGPFILRRLENVLQLTSEQNNVRLSAINLTKTIISRDTGKPLHILHSVSLAVNPGEFVALLGPSGSGKSTLMDALSGRRPASSGQLLANDEGFYANYRYLKASIAYVPQKDIVHCRLTVNEALDYAAQLRLPPDTSEEEIQKCIDRVLSLLGLVERRGTVIANLSGGQLKRVSLGVELLADPSLVYLDEATSGLDAATEGKMMTLFRDLANQGKSVICITHNVENVSQCDLVAAMFQGRMAYYGPPSGLTTYFKVEKISQVYEALESQAPDAWDKDFRASPNYRKFVSSRLQEVSSSAPPTTQKRETTLGEKAASNLRQVSILTRRSGRLLVRDAKNLGILLGQAPVIGSLIALVLGLQDLDKEAVKCQVHVHAAFLMTISAIWFGCTNAAKEIVKELPIYLRERAVNLELPAYVGSKVVLLSLLSCVQCLALLLIVSPAVRLDGGILERFAILFLTSFCGLTMGLCISALVDNTDKAMSIVPLVLIPQVVLAGAIVKLPEKIEQLAACTMVSYWSFEAMILTMTEPVRKMVQKDSGSWTTDSAVLILFAGGFMLLCCAALRRRDVLS